MKVYKVWCEYDFEQDSVIFLTEKEAWDWIKEAWEDAMISEEFTEDLCGVTEKTVLGGKK